MKNISFVEVIVLIVGILLCFTGKTIMIIIGVACIAGVIGFVISKLNFRKHETEKQEQGHQNDSSYNYQKQQENSKEVKKKESPKVESKQEKDSRLFDAIFYVKNDTKTKILSQYDVKEILTNKFMQFYNNDDLDYICEVVFCPLFGDNIKSILEKIHQHSLVEKEIIAIIKYGTPSIKFDFVSNYKDSDWKMSSTIFEEILRTQKMMLLEITNYSVDMFVKLLDNLESYELLGYCIHPTQDEKEPKGPLENYLTGEKFVYYCSLETDIVYIAEQYFTSSIKDVRKLAFDKASIVCDLVDVIGRVDSLTEYETKKIIDRSIEEEIEALFNRNDKEELINYLSPIYAIKAVLGLNQCSFYDFIKDNYNFDEIKNDIWEQIFSELSPMELLGYRIIPNEGESPEGSLSNIKDRDPEEFIYYSKDAYSIVQIIEDCLSNDDIREKAFDKISLAKFSLAEEIEYWNNITDYEIRKIFERGIEEEIEALFNRNDTDYVVENMPDDYIIKSRLGFFDFGDIDELNEEYENRMEKDEFKNKIEKLLSNL